MFKILVKYKLFIVIILLALIISAVLVYYFQNRQPLSNELELEPSKQFYFAYGSNMSLDNMSGRCGDGAKVIGPALLADYELTFDKRGYANIIAQTGQQVWGVAWQIDQNCLKALDRYEGYPRMYDRQDVQINLGPQTITAMVYIEPADQSGGQPSRSYLDNRVIPGAKENGLPAEWIKKLEQY